jgi:hypothetical protein
MSYLEADNIGITIDGGTPTDCHHLVKDCDQHPSAFPKRDTPGVSSFRTRCVTRYV